MFDFFRRRINVVKAVVYTALSISLGVASIVQQTSADRIFVSSIFEMKFSNTHVSVRRSSSGYMTRVSNENCVAKIIMPFDTPPSSVEEKYYCKWEDDSTQFDSLCYTDFGCKNVDVVLALSLVSPSMLLFGYILLSGLIFYQRIRSRFLPPKLYWSLSGFGFFILVTGFIIAKLIPFITDYLFTDVFDHIRKVTIRKGGFDDITYDIIKYVFEPRVVISRTMTDIMAGFTAAFFFMILEESYRRKRKLKRSPMSL